jgi:hypothetical protein
VILYVIHGSHACRAAMLMLAHKQIPYRLVTLPTGAHPMLLRARGFAGHAKPIRSVDGRAHRSLALLDRMGTVPALRCGAERVQTNRDRPLARARAARAAVVSRRPRAAARRRAGRGVGR